MLKSKFENYKSFPYVSWAIFILFCIFVYSITLKLNAVATELEVHTARLESKANQPVTEIKDFEN